MKLVRFVLNFKTMAGSVNKVILVGNLGKDPEVRRLESGSVVATFPLATNESYKDKNGNRVDNTEWHNIVLWRGLAEISEKYLRKGSMVYIEGKLKTRSWEDQNNQTRYTTEVVGDNMTMLGSRDGGNSMGGNNPGPSDTATERQHSPQTNADSAPASDDDDLPF